MAQFEYTKEMIYTEFKEATVKDEKSKKPSYKHRVAMLKDMIALKRSNPQEAINPNPTVFIGIVLAFIVSIRANAA